MLADHAMLTQPMSRPTSFHALFHELILTLLGLFEIYDADPVLVEHTAEEVEALLRRFMGDSSSEPSVKGKLALERLLDELETDD